MRMFLINSCRPERVPGNHQLGHEGCARVQCQQEVDETQNWTKVGAKVEQNGHKLMSLGNGLELRPSSPLAKSCRQWKPGRETAKCTQ